MNGAESLVYDGKYNYVPGNPPSSTATGWGEREFAKIYFAHPIESSVYTGAIHETGRVIALWHRTSTYRLRNYERREPRSKSEYRWLAPVDF